MPNPFPALEATIQRPDRGIVMRQSWRNLLFLHCEVEPELIQNLLPPGLTVELFDGKAWVGLVIFQMSNIRFASMPAIPGLSAFPETNVRTYVVDKNGIPGVWFFSLDASNLLACLFARLSFNLNYIWARMDFLESDGTFSASGKRKQNPTTEYQATWTVGSVPTQAEPKSFDFWLVERYLLYAKKGNQLYSGKVFHQPYTLQSVHALTVSQNLIPIPGYEDTMAWSHVTFSPGVDVEVYGLKKL